MLQIQHTKKGFAMKSTLYIASLLISIGTSLHAMKENQIIPTALPDYKEYTAVWSSLCIDYKKYVASQLETYKTTDTVDMPKLDAMKKIMTNHTANDIVKGIDDVHDDHKNTFLHIAVEKRDGATVKWLCRRTKLINVLHYVNRDRKTPLDLCVDQLLPEIDNTNNIKAQSQSMLADILYGIRFIPNGPFYKPFRNRCQKTLINLHLQYKKNTKNNFLCPTTISQLQSLIRYPDTQSCITEYYQEATDTATGNTFTHVLVEQERADELFDWIKQKRLSLVANKTGLTPLDIALAQFRIFTQNFMLIDEDKSSFENRRCCLFILLNHLKIKDQQSETAHFDYCCDKHNNAVVQ